MRLIPQKKAGGAKGKAMADNLKKRISELEITLNKLGAEKNQLSASLQAKDKQLADLKSKAGAGGKKMTAEADKNLTDLQKQLDDLKKSTAAKEKSLPGQNCDFAGRKQEVVSGI